MDKKDLEYLVEGGLLKFKYSEDYQDLYEEKEKSIQERSLDNLEIDVFLDKVWGKTKYSSGCINDDNLIERIASKEMFLKKLTKLKSAIYRQDIYYDLLNNSETLNKCLSAITGLPKFRQSVNYFRNIDKRSELTDIIESFLTNINTLDSLKDINSEGLMKVKNYASFIKNSSSFKELGKILERENKKHVNIIMDNETEMYSSSILDIVYTDKMKKQSEWFNYIDYVDAGCFRNLRINMNEILLGKLKTDLKPYFPVMQKFSKLLTQLKIYTMFAKYYDDLRTKGYNICFPELQPKENLQANIKGLQNPLIDISNNVANDFEYDKDLRQIIITGPNYTGKSVILKTLGLATLSQKLGLPLVADEGTISLVEGVFMHVPKEGTIENNESTFSSEVHELTEILQASSPYSIHLFDELCKGTNYTDGVEQANMILNALYEKERIVVAATHWKELTENAKINPAGINLYTGGEEPKYALKQGIATQEILSEGTKKVGFKDVDSVLNLIK